jgi:Flp pilus assembly pilin Flp
MNGPFTVRTLRNRIPRDQGQDLLEYAFLAALIAIAAIASVGTVGTKMTTVFWDVIASVK